MEISGDYRQVSSMRVCDFLARLLILLPAFVNESNSRIGDHKHTYTFQTTQENAPLIGE